MTHNLKKIIILLLIIPFLTACGGAFQRIENIPAPSAMDETKTCGELKSEIENEYVKCEEYAEEIRIKHGVNAGAAVGCLFFWPMLFALDLSKTDNINYSNQVSRYNWLVSVAEKKECNIEPYKLIDVNSKPIPKRKAGEPPVFTNVPN